MCFGLPCSFQRGASSETSPGTSGLNPNPRREGLLKCLLPLPSPQLMLPDGITVEVIVVNQVNAGHLFVQQHTHPTFHALRSLDQQMYLCYSQPGIPTLPTPVESKCCPEGRQEPGQGRGLGVACSAPGILHGPAFLTSCCWHGVLWAELPG